MPILGAWMADEFLGRLKTIQGSLFFALVGHILILISSLPPVMVHTSGALTCFAIGLVIFGIGVGGFKCVSTSPFAMGQQLTESGRSNIAPLIAEQYKETRFFIKTIPKTGERVIVDPAQTITRIFLYFYFVINVGALVGSIAMVYAEKYMGFWFAYMLPTLMFLFCPAVLFICRNKYQVTPPTGSVVGNAVKLWALALGAAWAWNPVEL